MNTNWWKYDLNVIDNYKRYLSKVEEVLNKHLDECKSVQGYVQVTSKFTMNTYKADVKVHLRTPKSSVSLDFSRTIPVALPDNLMNQWIDALDDKLMEAFNYVQDKQHEVDLETTKEAIKLLKKQTTEQNKLVKVENQIKRAKDRQRKLNLSDISKYQDLEYKGLSLHPISLKGHTIKYCVDDTPVWFSINTAYVNPDTLVLDIEKYNTSKHNTPCVSFDDLLLMNINRFHQRFWNDNITKFVEEVGNEHNS